MRDLGLYGTSFGSLSGQGCLWMPSRMPLPSVSGTSRARTLFPVWCQIYQKVSRPSVVAVNSYGGPLLTVLALPIGSLLWLQASPAMRIAGQVPVLPLIS